jgi:hypothetical protein
MMTDQEYEIEYRHALHELRKQGYEVVEPGRTQDRRLVLIDGFPCSDWEVFSKAYGEQIAEMIAEERPRPMARHAQAS